MRRVAVLFAALAAVGAAVPGASPGGGSADAACLLFVRYGGAPFVGGGAALPAADVQARVGTGIVPGCNDVIGPWAPPPAPDTAVALRRVRDVAPRFAVAMRLGGVHGLMVRDGAGCSGIAVADRLACLRAATTRFLRGPSLVAPLSAARGATIRIAVRFAGRPARAPSGPVTLRPADGGPAPAPLVRSGGAVVIPDVAPGEYRLVTVTDLGTGARGLAARITIR